MGVNLCIDWGNSFVKAAIFSEDKIVESFQSADTEAIHMISTVIEKYKPEAAMLCSVAGNQEATMLTLRNSVRFVYKLDMNTSLPIMNAYHSPDTLGTDRLALMAGAFQAFPDKNTLVVSMGTCITYNFLQKNKAFRGGAISPGLQMRFKCMHDYTDKLPFGKPEGDLLLLGYDTDTSLRSGVVHGIMHEIEGTIAAYAAQYPDFNAVLTGGDAAFFGNKLKSKIFADPDLLMKGLNLILNHNVPKIR